MASAGRTTAGRTAGNRRTAEEAWKQPEETFELPPEGVLPPVTHFFLIVLRDQGFEATFGKKSTSPYLAKTLAEKGEVLNNYYAVSQGDLANEIALLSGQGPTAQTAADCPEYTDVTPGTVDPATVGATEQVEGTGCVPGNDADATRPARRRRENMEDLRRGR